MIVILGCKALTCGNIHADALKVIGGWKILIYGLKHHLGALSVDSGSQHDRNDISFYHMFPKSRRNLINGKFITREVTLHIFLTGFCHSLHKSSTGNSQILLAIFRNLTFFIITVDSKTAACHLNNINKTYELFVLTNGEVERCYLSSEFFIKL